MKTTVEERPGAHGAHLERIVLGENIPNYARESEIVSNQTLSSKTRTVETITVNVKC